MNVMHLADWELYFPLYQQGQGENLIESYINFSIFK